ncbi:MAG: hypothetical protein AUG75_05665 [Cyanobacteria bacterium 13_1_20CM_4_61_6]|nr:MAG: hypothetical protein AUG75_05665 [Cyanobacteria bacterium 13_1_20CM_4_61_6]
MPAQAIKPDQFIDGVIGGVGQSGEATEQLRAKAIPLESNHQQAAIDWGFAASGLELVLAAGFPTQRMVAHPKGAPQKFARAPIGQAKQYLLPRLTGGLHHAEDSKITVPDE